MNPGKPKKYYPEYDPTYARGEQTFLEGDLPYI